MRSAHGFALIAVLWMLTALSGIVGVAVGAARLGQQTSVNRLTLTRGRWAAEACLAIAQARWWMAHRLVDADTEDLGRGARCAWEVADPAALINVNTVEPEILAMAVCRGNRSACALDSLLHLRETGPITDLAQVASVTGLDSSALAVLTLDGLGSINANAASPAVLLDLPGLMPEAVARLADRRRAGRPIASVAALAEELSPAARASLLAHYADLVRQLVFAPPLLRLTARGWVDGFGGSAGLHATIEVLVVPLPARLAIVRQRLW